MGAMLSAKAKARLAGAVSVTLFTVFAAGMTANSHKTREEKERERAALAERDRERAVLGAMIAPRFPPPVRSAQQEWTSVPHWGRGIYEGAISVSFPGGWVFPFGTNHLSSVEVMSCGAVFPDCFSRTQVVSLGAHLSFVPGVSSFCHGLTPSNTYAFVWSDTRNGRIDGESFDGRIEFFRNGDVCVVTNGVSEFFPRELPFPHDGYGQDDEWVEANFTNATEIATAGGYAAWVDAQVGEGLTNGYFKFTATFPEVPQEATQLVVGGLSLAVTNAGSYVFLLEKGVSYGFGTMPFSPEVVYSAVDDVPLTRGGVRSSVMCHGPGCWSISGGCDICDQTASEFGNVIWMPMFYGSPNISYLGLENGTMVFTANLSDYRGGGAVTYAWFAPEGISIASPNAQTTEVEIESMPSWAQSEILVTASLGGQSLVSSLGFIYGTNETPQVHLSLNAPKSILLNSNEVSSAKIATVGWAFSSDAPTSGVVRLRCESGTNKVSCPDFSGAWNVPDVTCGSASVEGVATSDSIDDVVLRLEFCGDGVTNVVERSLTVVNVCDVHIPSAPDDGLIVLTNTPIAMHLGCRPQGATELISSLWQVRRLKSDGTHEPWQLVAANYSGASAVFVPEYGGIYEVRALASVAASGVDERLYSWTANDPFGLKRIGEAKSIGVCNEQWQISLRDCAKTFLGSTAYLEEAAVPAQYGFSAMPGRRRAYKCNLFVAHRIVHSGITVPAIHGIVRSYPPVANDWGNRSFVIEGWLGLDASVCPQPGFVSADPSGDESPGHVGIVDFDGMGISAGRFNVNRNFDACNAETVLRKFIMGGM